MRRWQLTAVLGTAALVAGCGGVQIAPQPVFPKALIEPLPATIGLVLPAAQRDYKHEETRGGTTWAVLLGSAQQSFARTVMGAMFREVREFPDAATAAADAQLQAVFEPHIEQYSFATAQETGGEYVAVTIRYRIEVSAPDGSAHDTLSLTGYGTSPTGAMDLDSSGPMDQATRAAMRDAAAKFMVQFGDLPLAATLAKGERVAGASPTSRADAAARSIEALPIRESRRRPAVPASGGVSPAAAPSGS
jgi:hypothetical protein